MYIAFMFIPLIVAEARLELTTFGLLAQRATTAPLRDIVAIIPDCECKGMNYFLQSKLFYKKFLSFC